MGVDCSLLMDYQAQGVGFGVIKTAYSLSQAHPDLNWEQLVAQHMSEEGLGWGRVKKADGTPDAAGPDELVEEGAQGKGWGKTLQKTRVAPGKPPWANGRSTKAR